MWIKNSFGRACISFACWHLRHATSTSPHSPPPLFLFESHCNCLTQLTQVASLSAGSRERVSTFVGHRFLARRAEGGVASELLREWLVDFENADAELHVSGSHDEL